MIVESRKESVPSAESAVRDSSASGDVSPSDNNRATERAIVPRLRAVCREAVRPRDAAGIDCSRHFAISSSRDSPHGKCPRFHTASASRPGIVSLPNARDLTCAPNGQHAAPANRVSRASKRHGASPANIHSPELRRAPRDPNLRPKVILVSSYRTPLFAEFDGTTARSFIRNKGFWRLGI